MFALREIVKDKLYAIATKNESDVFHDCFKKWNDPLYLYDFFSSNSESLKFYQVDVKTATSMVLLESKKFFIDILKVARGEKKANTLDKTIFVPLHNNDDFEFALLETKAYGSDKQPSFLRIYAIRLKDGCYIVVGGLLKTTQSLQECKEGKRILATLKSMISKLQAKGYKDAFDIAIIVI